MNNIIAKIESRSKFGIKLGLDNISTILKHLDNPQDKLKIIHIAGTNGKGSVSSMISSGLQAAGFMVAKYCSPYLIDLTEMFVINDQPIMTTQLQTYYHLIEAAEAETGIILTQYEVTTTIMFLFAEREKVDYLILEVGLGGRLDATNVVNPEVSIITNISLDHTNILGNTIAEIAFEKAGIIKPGVPLFTTETNPEALTVFKSKTDLITVVNPDVLYQLEYEQFTTKVILDGNYNINLFGSHQVVNFVLAKAVLNHLQLDNKFIKQGVANCIHPGRLEKLADNIIFDGAHNPASATALVNSLTDYPAEIKIICSVLKDKDVSQVINILRQLSSNITFIPLPDLERGLSAAEFSNLGLEQIAVKLEVGQAIEPNKLNLVCGTFSLYTRTVEYLKGKDSE